MLVVRSDGQLRPRSDRSELAAEELFAVVIVWGSEEGSSWLGWLTTTDHRSVCFTAADLEDLVFQHWLAALPGWSPSELALALVVRGIYLVWRRSAS